MPVGATEEEIARRAAQLNQEARGAFDAGDWTTAIERLEEAIALTNRAEMPALRDPVLWFNLAKTYQKMAEGAVDTPARLKALDHAIAAYDEYLAMVPPSEDRAAIDATVRGLRKQRVDLALPRPLPDTQVPDIAVPTKVPPTVARSTNRWPWILIGTGTAFALASVGCMWGVKFENDEAVRACQRAGGLDCAGRSYEGLEFDERLQVDKHLDHGRTFETLQYVSFGVGAAALAGGTVWWLLDRRSRAAERNVSLQVGPGTATVMATF